MNKDQLQDWIQIVGLFAVVASLVFVGIEVRQSGRAAQDSSLVGDVQGIIAVEELVIDNADVWRRVWDEHMRSRYHLPDDLEFHQFRDAVEAVVEQYRQQEPTPHSNPARCGLN